MLTTTRAHTLAHAFKLAIAPIGVVSDLLEIFIKVSWSVLSVCRLGFNVRECKECKSAASSNEYPACKQDFYPSVHSLILRYSWIVT